MGCLSASVELLNKGLSAKVDRIGGLVADYHLLNPPLRLLVNDLSERLRITFGIVCSVEDSDMYLRVQPSDVQWVTPDNEIVYVVRSNVDWEIEIN